MFGLRASTCILSSLRSCESVAICARRKDVLEATAEEIRRESGRKVLAIAADLTRREDAENFVHGAARHFGRIDILVLNASVRNECAFLDLPYDDWRRVMTTTLDGKIRTRLLSSGVDVREPAWGPFVR